MHSYPLYAARGQANELDIQQLKGMRKAVANNDRANQARREMNSAQVQASSLVYGQNGITRENGWVKDAEGNIKYVGKK